MKGFTRNCTARLIPEAQANARQRVDNSLPFGNNRIRKLPIRPTAGIHNEEVSAKTRSGRHSEPGSAIQAYQM